MSIKKKFKNKEIQLVVWVEIYYRPPENTTHRQVLMKQHWKHGPDLSRAAAQDRLMQKGAPPPNALRAHTCLCNVFWNKHACSWFKTRLSYFQLSGRWTILFCTETNTISILLLISERVSVWEKNDNSNYAENPDKLKGTLGNLHGWRMACIHISCLILFPPNWNIEDFSRLSDLFVQQHSNGYVSFFWTLTSEKSFFVCFLKNFNVDVG